MRQNVSFEGTNFCENAALFHCLLKQWQLKQNFDLCSRKCRIHPAFHVGQPACWSYVQEIIENICSKLIAENKCGTKHGLDISQHAGCFPVPCSTGLFSDHFWDRGTLFPRKVRNEVGTHLTKKHDMRYCKLWSHDDKNTACRSLTPKLQPATYNVKNIAVNMILPGTMRAPSFQDACQKLLHFSIWGEIWTHIL